MTATHTVPGDPSERFPCLVDLKESRKWNQVGQQEILPNPITKGPFLYLVARCDSVLPGMFSAGTSNSLTWEFCLEGLELALTVGRKPRSSTPIRGVSSPPVTSWKGSRQSEIKISWSGRGRCLRQHAWWMRLMGGKSNMKKEGVPARLHDGWES